MRADRLVATLLFLQARRTATAAEIAAELEVSTATARRDLEALAAAGVPVYPQRGRHGGWALVGGARTDLTGLTAPEAEAIFRVIGPASTGTPEIRSAMRKLVRALPEQMRPAASIAADATVVDPTRWGESDSPAPPPHPRNTAPDNDSDTATAPRTPTPRPDLLGVLQTAVAHRQRLRVGYLPAVRSTEAATVRVLDPLALVGKRPHHYLLARPAGPGSPTGDPRTSATEPPLAEASLNEASLTEARTYRLDRITSVEPTGETFDIPKGFDADEAWARVVDAVERKRSAVEATVLIDAVFAPILGGLFGRHHRTIRTDDEGRVVMVVAASKPVEIARILAGWGNTVDVIEPPSVQHELARIGAELVERYNRPAGPTPTTAPDSATRTNSATRPNRAPRPSNAT